MQVEKFFISEEMKELLQKKDEKSKEDLKKELKAAREKRKRLYLFVSTIWGLAIGFLLIKDNLIAVAFGIAIGLLVGIAFSNRLEILVNKRIELIDKNYEEKEKIVSKGVIWEGQKEEEKKRRKE